jgi:hypothetical protein
LRLVSHVDDPFNCGETSETTSAHVEGVQPGIDRVAGYVRILEYCATTAVLAETGKAIAMYGRIYQT